jgi:argininosuccinate lyase
MTEQQPAKMWSGRFREPLDPRFESWQRSLPFDVRLLPQEIAASHAHARAIAAAGILTPAELETTLRGLDAIAASLDASLPDPATTEAEDVHHYAELRLTKEIGDLALKLHTGRSRNEQIATDLRLFVRDAIDATVAPPGSAWARRASRTRFGMPKTACDARPTRTCSAPSPCSSRTGCWPMSR